LRRPEQFAACMLAAKARTIHHFIEWQKEIEIVTQY
jgi:hypothetical protein